MNTQSVKQVEEVREISAITYGFMASKALFAALELDVFTQIADGADTLPILARATGIAENRLVTLLTALKSLGLIAESRWEFHQRPCNGEVLSCRRTRRFQGLRQTRQRRLWLRELPPSGSGVAG